MKKTLIAVLLVVLAASHAVASDDITVSGHNTNNNTLTNTNTNTATSTSTATGGTGNGYGGDASTVVQRNLPEVGFVGFMNPGTPIVGTDFQFFYSKLYSRLSVKKIAKMRYGFHLSDLFPTKWGGRAQYTPQGESLPKNEDDVLVMEYWPELVANVGDEVLGSAIIVGEPDWDDQAFVGEAAAICKEETMTRRIAIAKAVYIDGVTVGASLGLSGSTAEVGKKSGYAVATGGVIGKNKVRAEVVSRVKVLCMNDGPLYLPGKPEIPAEPVKPVQQTEPKQPKKPTCDRAEIQRKIIALEKKHCPNLNNANLERHVQLAELDIEMFLCTNDRTFLQEEYTVEETGEKFKGAVGHYGRAQMNFNEIVRLAKQKKASAVEVEEGHKAVRTMNEDVYDKWSVAILITKGEAAQNRFIREHSKVLHRRSTGYAE